MLTAFNYYEPEEEKRIQNDMKKNDSFYHEVDIAKEYTKKINCDSKQSSIKCPFCSCDRLDDFYIKWDIQYVRCEKCYSVFAQVEEHTVWGYQNYKPLVELRQTEAYQKEGYQSRQQRWEELLDWIKFRSYRYLGKSTELRVLDYGTKWKGQIDTIKGSDLCKKYVLKESIFSGEKKTEESETYDIVLAIDYLQHVSVPDIFLEQVYHKLDDNGIFILNTKVGSGIDILALRQNNSNVFPCEHVMMPSKEGVIALMEKKGFEILEFTTPGTFDVNYLKDNIDKIDEKEYFLKYFLESATPSGLADLQHFVQKNGLSSYAQVIARKKQK